jgi:hypothetical protein
MVARYDLYDFILPNGSERKPKPVLGPMPPIRVSPGSNTTAPPVDTAPAIDSGFSSLLQNRWLVIGGTVVLLFMFRKK